MSRRRGGERSGGQAMVGLYEGREGGPNRQVEEDGLGGEQTLRLSIAFHSMKLSLKTVFENLILRDW